MDACPCGEASLPGMSHTEMTPRHHLVERLCTGSAAMPNNIGAKKTICLTTPFGVSLLDSDAPAETPLEHADKAMHAVNSSGRNGVPVWAPAM